MNILCIGTSLIVLFLVVPFLLVLIKALVRRARLSRPVNLPDAPQLHFRADTKRSAEGNLDTYLYNHRGILVAKIEDHNFSLERIMVAARDFFDENPDLLDSLDPLVFTAEEIQNRNPELFEGGGLDTVPGH